MRIFRSIMMLFLFLITACTREQVQPYAVRELPVRCDGSKVSLRDGRFSVWNAGDAFSVFYGTTRNYLWKYKGEDGAEYGKIEGLVPYDIGGKVVALYPYNSEATLDSDILTTCLPRIQPFCRGSFSASSAILYSVESGGVCNFSYANAIVVLTMEAYRSFGISSVDFSDADGDDVAGDMRINIPEGTASVSGYGAINMPFGQTIGEGASESFYFCVPAREYESGICFTVHVEGGPDRVVRYTSPLSLHPGNLLEVKDLYCRSYQTTINFRSNTGFDPKLPTAVVTGSRDFSFEDTELGLLSFGVSNTTGGFRYYSGKLRVNDGADGGDASIRLPYVPGLSLSGISVLIENQSGRAFKVGTKPGLSDLCEPQTAPSGVKTLIPVDYSGENCYLSVSAKNTQIIEIELTYN